MKHFTNEDIYQIGDFEKSLCYKVDKDTLGQYTGLHDKNGKEIYEGDAWEDEDGYYIIVWDEKEAGFLVDTYGFEEWLGEGGQECYGNKIEFISREPIDYFDFSKIEITKNIYDNPDLLEKDQL